MTPEELEALADRVESGDTAREIDAMIFIAITPGAMLARDHIPNAVEPDVQCWVPGRTERGEFLMPPAYRRSLDAAAQVMPARWCIRVEHLWPECLTPDRRWYAEAVWPLVRPNWLSQNAQAPTECDARVAAGLRARAHVLRNGGAA